MHLKTLLAALLFLWLQKGFGQEQQFLGFGIIPSFSYLKQSELRPPEQGIWTNCYQLSYRTQLNANWHIQASFMILNSGATSKKQPLRWPSEFDPTTGSYQPDPNLPKFLSYSTIYQSVAAPVELAYYPGKHGRWGLALGISPTLHINRRAGTVFYFTDGRTEQNLRNYRSYTPQLGAVLGAPVLLPVGKYWKIELQPKIMAHYLGKNFSHVYAYNAGGSVQVFRQLGVRSPLINKKKASTAQQLEPAGR